MDEQVPEFNDLLSEILQDVEVMFVYRQGYLALESEPMVALRGKIDLQVGKGTGRLHIPIVLPLLLSDARSLIQKLETTIAQAEHHWYQMPPSEPPSP